MTTTADHAGRDLTVYPKVAETMADALGCDVEDIKLDVSLIEGLDAESIDFLDIVFRLERAFKIKIPRGKIVEDARGDLPEAEFEQKGFVTEAGLRACGSTSARSPPTASSSPMKVGGHSAAVHARDVLQARRARAAGPAGRAGLMPDRFAPSRSSTGSRRSKPGRRARARFAIPAALPAFPPCLVAEAVGQLAALGGDGPGRFPRRPVAALARETRFVGDAAPGAVLDLGVEIERCDRTRVAYGGWARVGDAPILELGQCLGPMLPLRGLRRPGGGAGRFRDALRTGRAARPLPGVTRAGSRR